MSVQIFICRRGARAASCFKCPLPHVVECAGPGKEDGTTCGRKLCEDHARRTQAGVFCAMHALNVVSANMPRPPGRPMH
jgi:hypothetical protein